MVINLCYDAERKGGFSSPFQARFAKHPFYRFSTRHVSSYFIFIRLAQNLILFIAIFMMWCWAISFVDVMICTSGNADQSVHLVAGEGLEAYLPLADMVDITSEIQRLSKRLSKMQTEYDGLITRLSSSKVWARLKSVYLCLDPQTQMQQFRLSF